MDASQIPNNCVLATPSDTERTPGCGLIYAGGACSIVTDRGDTVTLPAVFAGIVLPIQVRQVKATGTSATSVLVFR